MVTPEYSYFLAFFPTWLVVVWSAFSRISESSLLTVGGASQLLGVVLIVIGADDALRQLGKSKLAKLWRSVQRLVRRLLGRTKTVPVRAQDGIHPRSSARGSLAFARPERAMSQLEKRLAALEEAHHALRGRVDGIVEQVDKIEEKLASESEALQAAIDRLREDSEVATVRRARVDLIGAALFFQGIILTTWWEAIARGLA